MSSVAPTPPPSAPAATAPASPGPRSGYGTATLLGAAVAFLGGAFLFSWYLNQLKEMMPADGFVPMQYNTALGFVITGLAVVAHGLGRARLAFWGGAVAAGLGSLSLAESTLGRSLHFVDAMFGGELARAAAPPMSINTSLCFALTGGMLVTWRVPRARARWRAVMTCTLAACVVSVGFVGLLGYVTHRGDEYGWARMTAMEAHTALGFVGLGTAFFIMLIRLKDAPVVATLPIWSGWVVGVGVAALTFTLWTSLTASDARVSALAEMRLQTAALAHTNQMLQSHLHALRRLALRCASPGRVRPEQFRDDAAILLAESPGLASVAFADRDGNVLGAQGAHDDRELEGILGLRQEVRAALRVAQDEGVVTASDPVSLLGPTSDLFVFVPVLGPDGTKGALVFEHDLAQLMDWIFGDGVGRAFNVEMHTLNGQRFYRRHGGGAAPHGPSPVQAATTVAAAPNDDGGRIGFADKVWIMRGAADGTGLAGGKNVSNTLILWFGMFLAVALSFVIRKSGLVRQRALSLAAANRTIEERQHSLKLANESLRATEAELTRAAREKRRVLDSLSAILVGVDEAGRVVEWNSVAVELFGLADAQALGQPFDALPLPWNRELVRAGVAECLQTGERVRRENLAVMPPGAGPDAGAGGAPATLNRVVSITINPTQTEGGRGFAIIGSDVTERQLLEMQLHQAQKLESVGTLAAGIAHEINTPMQFVSDNLRFVSQSVEPLTAVLQLVPEVIDASRAGAVPPDLASRLQLATAGVDVSFLADELPAALGEMQEGVDRVTTIVRAMKDFSHPGNQGRQSADLNKAIATTLSVARNEYKYYADVKTDYGDIPLADCYVADLNQVFLNLLVNAAHAIRDVVGDGSGRRGTIRITTRLDGDCIEIRVSDTGSGIPEHVRGKIFDQFFTTKGVGRGTGLGLAIARAVVVEKHRGTLHFETEVGKGTTFFVRIPVSAQPEGDGPDAAAAPAAAGEGAPGSAPTATAPHDSSMPPTPAAPSGALA